MITELERIVTPRYVATGVFEGMKNATTPLGLEVAKESLPYAVVMPVETRQVARILELANRLRVPVFVRGSGTSLIGHSRPHCPGIVLNTHRMRDLAIDEACGYFECGPGITAAAVGQALEAVDCFLPVWPGSRVIASMGGLVCNNTSGHIVDACLGKPGDYVLGLEVVLPTGEIIQTGSKGLRRIAGTDLTKFFVGSDGLLGVVTRIRMRLVPKGCEAHGLAVFDDLGKLARGVGLIFARRLPPPLFMEMMDEPVARIGYRIRNMTPPAGAVVMFGAVSADRQGAAAKIDRMLEVFSGAGARQVQRIEDEAAWHKIVAAREVIGSYLLQEGGGVLNSAEVVANLAQLEAAMDDAVHFNRSLPLLGELQNHLFGHIGALTFHPSFVFPRAWADDRRAAALDELFQREAELNLKYDTCGGEWGQFGRRTPFFRQKYGEAAFDLVRAFKTAADPHHILNPGILEGRR